jgi:hypothetical protein
MRFRVWVTFRAASEAEGESRTAGPRRVFCAARMFELSDAEFEELWPGLERLLNNAGRPCDALDVRPHDTASGNVNSHATQKSSVAAGRKAAQSRVDAIAPRKFPCACLSTIGSQLLAPSRLADSCPLWRIPS